MNWLLIHQLAEWAIRLLMVPIILRRRFRPNVALAWLMLTFLIPEVGFILYMLFGDARLGRKRVRLHQIAIDQSRKAGRIAKQLRQVVDPKVTADIAPVILQAEKIGGMAAIGGSHVELLGDTNTFIDRLVADIDAATKHVHLLFYIYAGDETGTKVSEALIRAAKRGVTCRLMVDSAGSIAFRRRSHWPRKLSEAGVKLCEVLPARLWRAMLSRMDLRNHRKLAIIDAQTAYTGSHNIVDVNYGKSASGKQMNWIDLSGRFVGPIVHQLQIIFMEDWAFETGEQLDPTGEEGLLPTLAPSGEMIMQTVATGPSDTDTTLPNVLLAAISAARRKMMITTPYFIPDEPTMLALLMAANRGVEVELIVPYKSDHWLVNTAAKFYFDPLLEAGVRIYQHHGGLLHSKTVTIDDSFALMGSTNMDVRSFHLNFELNVLMYGPQITRELRFAQTSYLAESKEIDLAQWRQRPAWKQYVTSTAALLSPLL